MPFLPTATMEHHLTGYLYFLCIKNVKCTGSTDHADIDVDTAGVYGSIEYASEGCTKVET